MAIWVGKNRDWRLLDAQANKVPPDEMQPASTRGPGRFRESVGSIPEYDRGPFLQNISLNWSKMKNLIVKTTPKASSRSNRIITRESADFFRPRPCYPNPPIRAT